jgi:hypothetical protein
MSDRSVCAAAVRLLSFPAGEILARALRAAAPLLVAALVLQGCGGGGGDDPPAPPSPPPTPPPAAPTGLSYTSPQNYTVGTAIASLTPTVTGTVSSFSVAPALPTGLALDTTTGTISGTPTAAAASTAYTITATNGGGSTTFALTLAALFERATADRTDENSGHQVHVMYVLPSDGADEELDKLGRLEGSVRSWSKWFTAQTGGPGVRLDTYAGGHLDVTFLRLAKTDAQMSAAGGNVRDRIEYQLLAESFDSPDKVYLVYYGGTGDTCGKSAWPPVLHGKVSAVYKTAGNGAACNSVAYAGENDPPRYPEFIAIHEVLHALGVTPQCAPHHSNNGHVTDSPTDVMFSGGASWAPSVLDVNHDDYFAASVPGCLGLQNSDFLEPLPSGALSPPGWPYATLTDLGCANESTTVPGNGVADTQAIIVNNYAPGGTPAPVAVSELVLNGAVYVRAKTVMVPSRDGVMLPTAATLTLKDGAVLVASANNVNGACLAVLKVTANPNRFVVR